MAENGLPDPTSPFGERVRRRLREEQVIWLITVSGDGTPQPNPVAFVFQNDDSVLIYSMSNATRLTHILARPHVALHFDGDGTGGDIVVFAGIARRSGRTPPAHENPAFLAKYGETLLAHTRDAAEFGRRFPVPLRIEITRTRGR